MKYLILLGLLCLAILLMVWFFKARKSDNELRLVVMRLLAVGILTVVAQGVYMVSEKSNIAYFFLSLYFVGIDAILVHLLIFAERYTNNFKSVLWSRILVYCLAGIDCVNMIANTFTKWSYELERSTIRGYEVWRLTNQSGFFVYHLVLTYFLVIVTALYLLYKTVITPKFYRGRYLEILHLFVVIVVVNGFVIFARLAFDISVFLYAIMGIRLCKSALFYKPVALIDKTLSLVVADINEAVFCFDRWGKCVYTNKRVEEYFGTEADLDTIEADFHAWVGKNARQLDSEITTTLKKEINGEEKYFETTYHKLFDKYNEYIGCFFTVSDRTEERMRFKKEHFRATHDPLTGIYNRQRFHEEVQKRIAENPDEKFCMVCSNIKGFKLYNDLFGAAKGDEVLKMEAELLQKFGSAGTVYGRISSDGFAIFLPQSLFEEAKFIYCINLMRSRFNTNQYQLHIYVGVYMIDDNSQDIFLMCDKANMAIDEHKGDYSTVVTFYGHELMERNIYEHQILGEFDRALEQNEFCMYLQPQIDTDGKMIGAEALVRWQHPERGLVFPGDFIEVFEKTGLIPRLDMYMWEEAAKKLQEWKKEGRTDLYISVNISAKDFYYMDVYAEVTNLVEKYDINPHNLKLEITETVLMTEVQNKLSLIRRLRDYGFIVEMDDFGSGYSSLNMLKNIEVDVIKLDMGFLRNYENTEKSMAILNGVVMLIKNLGVSIVSEGVETREQVDNLTEMGCNVFQGYYFAKPITVQAFEEKYGL